MKLISDFLKLIDWGWAFQQMLIVVWGIAVNKFTEYGIKEELIKHPFFNRKLVFKGFNEFMFYLIYLSATMGLCAIVSVWFIDYFFKLFPLTLLISIPIVFYRLTKEIIKTKKLAKGN